MGGESPALFDPSELDCRQWARTARDGGLRGLILTADSAKAKVDLGVRAEARGFDSVFNVEFFNQHAFPVLGALGATAWGKRAAM